MGTQPLHAMHRTVVVLDVSAFGQRPRAPQEDIRRGLYAALEAAFDDSGLDWSATHHEDRGDGVLVLVPPDVPKSRVVGGLPHALLGGLRRHNATRNEDARIRLRMAITAGEVQHDEHGVVGDDVTLAFRLLDAKPLRDALAHSTALFALIVSQRFFEDVVRPDPAADPASFRRVDVDVKEVRGHAWLHVPDGGAPAIGRRPTRHRRKRGRPRWAPVLLAAPLLFVGTTNGAGAVPLAVPPCRPPVQLNVLVSAEKEPVVREVALEFEKDSRRHDPQGCKEVNVLVFPGVSARAAAEALGHGWQSADLTSVGPEPHVWLPDSTAEVRAVEAALLERADVRLRTRQGVAVSPVVLGASEEFAERIGVSDGEFRWTHAGRPAEVDTSSGVGLAAATALAHAKLGGLYLEAPNVPRKLHEITRETTADEPCAGDVTLVGSEKAVAGTKGCRVLYPQGGSLVLDHPFVEVQRTVPPPNQRRSRIVPRFLDHLLSPPAQELFRRAGFRDVAWNVGSQPGPGVRSGRPRQLDLEPDARAVRQAWEAARRGRVIAVAGDGSADADRFADAVRGLAGPGDEVIGGLALSAGVVEEALARRAHVVVLTSVADVPPITGGPVRVVGVGFRDGACARSTALYEAAIGHEGSCHEVGGTTGSGASESRERALDDVARAAWGG